MSERRARYAVHSPGLTQGGNGARDQDHSTPRPVPLTGGSLKQIAWAERIRSRVLRMVPQALAGDLAQVRSAQFWITHRERTPDQWLGITAREGPSLFRVESPRYTRQDGADWARHLALARFV